MSRRSRNAHAFTLLEVLIAVVVLAFGLLGVVAVFPAVIDLQRRSQDAVLGGSLAASAEAGIAASLLDPITTDWTDWTPYLGDNVRLERFSTRDLLLNDRSISVARDDGDFVELDFGWDGIGADASGDLTTDGDLVFGGTEPAVPFRFNATTGEPLQGGRLARLLPRIEIGIDERLLPDASSGAAPRYVWDAFLRRVDVGIGEPTRIGRRVPVERLPDVPVEMVVFVRPIDRGIRRPPGRSLREVLQGYAVSRQPGGETVREVLDQGELRYPVAVRTDDLASSAPGAAREDAQYSVPISAERNRRRAILTGNPQVSRLNVRTELRISANDLGVRPARRSLARIGQLFVDNFGTVHRVTRVIAGDSDDDEIPEIIEFSPPMNPGWEQIVFTPQVPADIRVIRTR
ncbi:MAG: prepilin-type N-terminal cleavage/methylation domain-containing protein [Planctomycetota bacterium]